ncbi:DUF2487 family protein [Cohnella panacarvi]|uniref:DUF2487 family protein n=1 Tax=Cohnella panacarvi TaxID=400776 RepID=UPI00047A556B|nr:DUF2487 family protein [Cohnella panacarvi]
MKFNEISEESWAELQPFLDTCLLPVSGLTGAESPWEATERILKTGDWLSPLEKAFHGRTVTMPAYHYDRAGGDGSEGAKELVARLKKSGFRYVVVVSGQAGGVPESVTEASLVVQPADDAEQPDPDALRQAVMAMWRAGAGKD